MAGEEATQAAPETPPAKSGLFGKLAIALFMGVVILTECLLSYFWIPSADEIAALAEERMTQKLHSMNIDESESGLTDNEKFKEFELGDYSITSHHPATNSSLRIDFKLVGTVLEEDSGKLEKLFERHKHRFRDQVLFEIRNSEVSDLIDPGLGLIKRRILEKSNRLFGEPVLKGIIFSNYSHIEQ